MNPRFPRILLLAACAAAIAGCGGVPLGSGADSDSTRALDALRGDCQYFTDQEILTLWRSTRANVDLGYTYGETIADIVAICPIACENTQPCTSACQICASAVADYVY